MASHAAEQSRKIKISLTKAYICTECGITFSTFEDQKTHEENSHGPNEIFEQEKN